jgi:hypothetical protein
MTEVLRYYRRRNTGEPLGAVYIGDEGVGWSSYNEEAEKWIGQPFTKKMARTIAKGRAKCERHDSLYTLPWKLWDTYKRALTAFMKRNGYEDSEINLAIKHDLACLKEARKKLAERQRDEKMDRLNKMMHALAAGRE